MSELVRGLWRGISVVSCWKETRRPLPSVALGVAGVGLNRFGFACGRGGLVGRFAGGATGKG